MNLDNVTCFEAHKACNKKCRNQECKFWHDISQESNCIINLINEKDNLTLQEVGVVLLKY